MEINPVVIKTAAEGTKFLLRIMPVFAAGVFAARLLEKMGLLAGLSRVAGPVMRLGRLSPGCGAGFITSIISPTAGHAMLAELRRGGKLGRRELMVAAVVYNLPGEIAAGKSVLPLALPALGVFGAAYYGLLLAASLVKASLMLLAGRFSLPRPAGAPDRAAGNGAEDLSFPASARAALKPALNSVVKVSRTMVPAAYAVYALIALGLFDKASGPLSFMTGCLPLNPAVLPVVAARLVSPVGAYTVAGGLCSSGAASGGELVLALFAGAFIATATSLRYIIPYYCGIFGGSDGCAIIAVSLVSRSVSYGAVLAALAFFVTH